MNALRHGFATSIWRRSLEPQDTNKETLAHNYTNMIQKRLDVEKEQAKLLANIDARLSAGDCTSITLLLQRAAALERYEEEISAAVSRLFKSLNAERKRK
jgi:hypothetical protein